MRQTEQGKFEQTRCAMCGESIAVPAEGSMIIYITSSVASARTSGFNGYCARCRRAFCSEHAVWQGLARMYSPHCPGCGCPLGGMNGGST